MAWGVQVVLAAVVVPSPSSAMIGMMHFNKCAVSDAMMLYNMDTWATALNEAWNSVEDMNKAGLYMLQTTSIPTADIILEIESAEEIKLDHFAPPDMFFFFATKAQATSLRSATGVKYVDALPANLKIAPDLRRLQLSMNETSEETPEIIIELSPGSKGSKQEAMNLAANWQNTVRGKVENSGANFTGHTESLISLHGVKGSDLAATLDIVASQPEAFVLEPIPDNAAVPPNDTLINITNSTQDIIARRLNNEADDITQSGQRGSTPLSDAGLTGEGEVVGIADSGLDDSSCFFNANADLQRNREADTRFRKVVQYIAFADGVAGEPNDHGTHVAGSVAGECTIPAGTIYNGMAPSAKIHFFDIGFAGQPSLSVPRSLQTGLFPFAKEAGAAIHTNSWGAATNRYTLNARDVDAYSYLNEEFVVLVAAGNDGDRGLFTVGSPATAKNCIAVGASVNEKQGNIEDIASFSSRGPTADGRIKPDVVAPGHNVLSAASERTCAITSQSGTSMATPVCAGTVALIRQYFREGFYPSGKKTSADGFIPPGALMKAVLIHSGRRMTGQVYGDNYPGFVQGFGRVDMDSVLQLGDTLPERAFWIHSSRIGMTRVALQQGESFEQEFQTTRSGNLKATLVWMDPPSSVNARKNLVNDLDLTVISTGTTFFPNGGNSPDTLNNVEMVEVSVPAPSAYTVRVTASSITSGLSQPFALVVTGPFNRPDMMTPVTQAPTPPPTPAPGSSLPPSQYTKITSGTCAAQGLMAITDVPTCESAATSLNLNDRDATTVFSTPRPEGCYFLSPRLYFAANRDNIGRGSDDIREQICQPSTVLFTKITSGTCADQGLEPITDVNICEAAAAFLQLEDQTVSQVGSTQRPEGCYYKDTLPGNALFLASNPNNNGNGAAGDREPICAAPSRTAANSANASTNAPAPAPAWPTPSPPTPVPTHEKKVQIDTIADGAVGVAPYAAAAASALLTFLRH